jgi:hypothetical protein
MSSQDNEKNDIRVAVTPTLEPHLRLYRRLWLARVDLDEALAAVDELLQARIAIPRRKKPPPLLLALTTALVVAYARPWVYSRGQSIAEKTVPGVLLRSLTAKHRSVHNALIDLRNQEVAHTDADILDLHLRLLPDGDAAILRTSREAFTRAELALIKRIIEKLTIAIDKRCTELRMTLPMYAWI